MTQYFRPVPSVGRAKGPYCHFLLFPLSIVNTVWHATQFELPCKNSLLIKIGSYKVVNICMVKT